jgi:hypothetical protein
VETGGIEMTCPVFVFAMASAPHIIDAYHCLPLSDYQAEPIGYLRGFEAEMDDHEMVKHELSELGLSLRFTARTVRARHGCRGALIAFAVEVPTYEDAEALPGFTPLGNYTGAYFVPPDGIEKIQCMSPDDVFEGAAIKRCDVTEFYKEFEPPPYGEDGGFFLSMIPMGILYSLVFLREDPLHFYIDGGLATDDESSKLAKVRRFAALRKSR